MIDGMTRKRSSTMTYTGRRANRTGVWTNWKSTMTVQSKECLEDGLKSGLADTRRLNAITQTASILDMVVELGSRKPEGAAPVTRSASSLPESSWLFS